MKTQEKDLRIKRKWWFRILKKIMKVRYKKPAFIFLGEKITNGGLIISNHEGTDAPMSLEIYLNAPLRMWGAHEMNSGLIKMYKYQTRVYYHEKKHWNLHLARLFCLIASPLTNLFYKGLNLISTYKDQRFIKTLKESVAALRAGENIVIFPENSQNGYLEELEDFFHGFIKLAEVSEKAGIDLPVFVSYFRKKDKVYIIDAPIYYSAFKNENKTRDEIVKTLLNRCNELGKMEFSEDEIKKAREEN